VPSAVIASARLGRVLTAAAHAGHGNNTQSGARQQGTTGVTASVAAPLDPTKCLVDVGQSASGGCQQSFMDLAAHSVRRRVWGDGLELVELIDSKLSLLLEKPLRGSDELLGERPQR
jgi:hypothetical protein